MKWVNKGNELIYKARIIMEQFNERKKIYIFGAGTLGEELRVILERYGVFAGYIDNDMKKQKNGWKGAIVTSFQDYCDRNEHGWIIVAASEKNAEQICCQLRDRSLCEGEDFFLQRRFMQDIFPILSFYVFDRLFVELAQICLTERCTLKCKKCAHACFNVPNTAKDLPLEIAKKSADIFFSRFDIINEFVLIGGEPFLYKELGMIISYIGERYRERMNIFSITTNGTILPGDELVRTFEKYDVTIRVSDYSQSNPRLKKQYGQLYKKIAGNKVSIWETNGESSWLDYGFGEIDRGDRIDELIAAFDKCQTPCREIRGSKYHYCVMARSVAENLGMNIGATDHIDLEEEGDRNTLLEFQMGFSDKGYLDMCRYCRGDEAKKYRIPAAEQV